MTALWLLIIVLILYFTLLVVAFRLGYSRGHDDAWRRYQLLDKVAIYRPKVPNRSGAKGKSVPDMSGDSPKKVLRPPKIYIKVDQVTSREK